MGQTHHLLAYADDVNLLGGNMYAVNKNTETLIDASKEGGLEANIEKTMLVSCHPNAGQYGYIKIVNRLFEYVAQFEYLGMTVKHQDFLTAEY
jgi:hypothetical protein